MINTECHMGLRPTNSNEHHGGTSSLILKILARDVRRSVQRFPGYVWHAFWRRCCRSIHAPALFLSRCEFWELTRRYSKLRGSGS